MVHLDVCGAAYDESALAKVPGSDSFVSLKVFSTPEYALRPNDAPGCSHKLIMLPTLRPSADRQNSLFLQPKSVRHFRCYHTERPIPGMSPPAIEVTPLQTFLQRNESDDEMSAKIDALVETLQQPQSLRNLQVGTKVLVCKIQSKPELNGRSGIITKATEKDHVHSDRVPVLVHGMRKPISLKLSCIRLPPQKQYRTPEEVMNLNWIWIAFQRIHPQLHCLKEKFSNSGRDKLERPCHQQSSASVSIREKWIYEICRSWIQKRHKGVYETATGYLVPTKHNSFIQEMKTDQFKESSQTALFDSTSRMFASKRCRYFGDSRLRTYAGAGERCEKDPRRRGVGVCVWEALDEL